VNSWVRGTLFVRRLESNGRRSRGKAEGRSLFFPFGQQATDTISIGFTVLYSMMIEGLFTNEA
jgi:hypothetical protein